MIQMLDITIELSRQVADGFLLKTVSKYRAYYIMKK
jgi:hypothetical protein